MSLNKKILALAIAGVLPGASYATVNLDTGANIPVFAEEIAPVPGTNLDNNGRTAAVGAPASATAATGVLGVQVKLGFSIVGSSKYARFDFPGSKLKTALTPENFRTADGNGATLPPATPATITIAAGGAIDSEFVIIELSGASLSNEDVLYFEPPASLIPATPLTLQPQSKVAKSINYRLYNDAPSAVNQLDAGKVAGLLAPATWYQFGPGLDLSCNTTGLDVERIDPIDQRFFVDGDPNTEFFNLVVTRKLPVVLDKSGLQVDIASYLPAGSTFKVTGNFSFLSPTAALITVPGADAINFATQTWTVGPAAPGNIVVPSPSGFGTQLVELNGFGLLPIPNGSPMIPGDYSVLVTPAAGALNTAPIDLGVCGRLRFGGSSDRIDFGLTPNSTNKQYFRITNPSQTPGPVIFSVYNDAGVQVDFPMSDVKVGPAPGVNLPATLGKLSSTPIIDVNALYAAAQAKDPSFAVGTNVDGKLGKLRVEVRGAFGEEILSGIGISENPVTLRFKDGIHIQAINNGAFGITHD